MNNAAISALQDDIEQAITTRVRREFSQSPALNWSTFLEVELSVASEMSDDDLETYLETVFKSILKPYQMRVEDLTISNYRPYRRVRLYLTMDGLILPKGIQDSENELEAAPSGEQVPDYLSQEWQRLRAEEQAACREAFDYRQQAKQADTLEEKLQLYELAGKAEDHYLMLGVLLLEGQMCYEQRKILSGDRSHSRRA